MADDDVRRRLEELSRKTGASVEESDYQRLQQTNPDDVDRLWGALESQYERRGASDRTGDLPDSSEYSAAGYGSARSETADDGGQPLTLNRPPSGPGGIRYGSGSGGVSGAYGAYLGSGQQQDPMLARLVQQLEADRARQEQERAQMREMVMAQLGEATRPVSADDPGIKPLIDAQKLALQRGSQRQRSAAVEQAGTRSLGDSGALNTRINQIEQGRGESEAAMIAQVLNNELGQKRNQVLTLLDLATRSGDAASARTLQGQLATLDQQMNQNRFDADLGFRNRTFDADLGFRREALDRGLDFQRYSFDNDLAYRLAQLQLLGNQGSMGFLNGLM